MREELEGIRLLVDSTEAEGEAENGVVRWSPVDFFGDAKRLSGRMCSKLEYFENNTIFFKC